MSGLRSLYNVCCWDYELDVHVIRYCLVTAVHETFPVTYPSDSIRSIPTTPRRSEKWWFFCSDTLQEEQASRSIG
jgi:hypothetical protein